MVIKKIPAGTRIYLTKKNHFTLYIQPNKTLVNDNLYVAYDVKVDGIVVIPRGTRVIGDWVTESSPEFAAQLQLSRIYLRGVPRDAQLFSEGQTSDCNTSYSEGQAIMADSDVINAISEYNNRDVNYATHLYKQNQYKATSNITRRIAKFQCHVKTLFDNNLNSVYLEIMTKEIPVTLLEDFIPYPCL